MHPAIHAEKTPDSVDPFRDDAPSELAAVRGGEELDWGRIETHLRSNLPDELNLTGGLPPFS